MAAITPKKFLALGDSYTIGESVPSSECWPMLLAHALRKRGVPVEDPLIIATTGWRTDDLKNAILKSKPGNDFDLVSLLIGVNNQYQGKSPEEYAVEFEELLHLAISFAGNDASKVFVLSIPDYGFTPFGMDKRSSISSAIDQFNSINKNITAPLRAGYIDVTQISRLGLTDTELVAPDNLHPSGKMYSEWVQKILETFPPFKQAKK